jgi:integrase
VATAATPLFGWIETRYSTREGMWNARYRYRLGKRVVTFDHKHVDRETAVELAEDTRLEQTLRWRRGKMPASQQARETSFDDFLETWKRRRLPQLSPNSQENYPIVIEKWLRPFLAGFALAELTPDVGYAWIEWMEEEGASPSTIERAANIASGIVTRAIRWRALDVGENPFRFVERPRVHRQRAPLALSAVHIWQLAEAMPHARDRAYVLLLGFEGLRQQEAIPLVWLDVLGENGKPRERLRVVKAVSGTGRRRVVTELKNRSSERYPQLFAPVGRELVRYYAEQGQPDLEALVFPTGTRDGMVNPHNWREDYWWPALDAAGVPRVGPRYGRLGPHRLRAACASMLGYAQWSKAEVLAHLGHAQETTTLTYYSRAIEDAGDLRGLSVEKQIERGRRMAKAAGRQAKLAPGASG